MLDISTLLPCMWIIGVYSKRTYRGSKEGGGHGKRA